MTQTRPPLILATIDVEAAHGSDPFEQMIHGRTDSDGDWGVYKIADTLEEFGATGTFFVDVYEDVLWGAKRMKDLCQNLSARGHDVQLHTHPSWRNDPRDSVDLNTYKRKHCRFPQNKDFMAKLSLDEQTQFIKEGKSLLESWIDKPVISHRSGGYSINADTVAALKRNGIFIDSSMNTAHANSKLTWSFNAPHVNDDFVELPVSVYRLVAINRKVRLFEKLLKTDLDSTPISVLTHLTDVFEVQKIPVMHLFMHSFTLLDMAPDFSRIKPHYIRYERLKSYLRLLTSTNRRTLSISDLTKIPDWKLMLQDRKDYLPEVVNNRFLARLVALRLKNTARLQTRRLFS